MTKLNQEVKRNQEVKVLHRYNNKVGHMGFTSRGRYFCQKCGILTGYEEHKAGDMYRIETECGCTDIVSDIVNGEKEMVVYSNVSVKENKKGEHIISYTRFTAKYGVTSKKDTRFILDDDNEGKTRIYNSVSKFKCSYNVDTRWAYTYYHDGKNYKLSTKSRETGFSLNKEQSVAVAEYLCELYGAPKTTPIARGVGRFNGEIVCIYGATIESLVKGIECWEESYDIEKGDSLFGKLTKGLPSAAKKLLVAYMDNIEWFKSQIWEDVKTTFPLEAIKHFDWVGSDDMLALYKIITTHTSMKPIVFANKVNVYADSLVIPYVGDMINMLGTIAKIQKREAALPERERKIRISAKLFKGTLKEMHDNVCDLYNSIPSNGMSAIPYSEKELELQCSMNGVDFVLPESTRTLEEVGKKMRICVGSYSDMAVSKRVTIVLMKRGNKSVGCIELRGNVLYQAKAFANARLVGEEAVLLKKWVEANHIHVDKLLDVTFVNDVPVSDYSTENMIKLCEDEHINLDIYTVKLSDCQHSGGRCVSSGLLSDYIAAIGDVESPREVEPEMYGRNMHGVRNTRIGFDF